MEKQDYLIIFRIHNKSNRDVQFSTNQGIDVLLTPDSVIDMYSFEVDGSDSFQNEKQAESIDVRENQKIQITKDDLERVRADISSYREDEPFSMPKEKKQKIRPNGE